MANTDFEPKDLTKEKSLWDVYIESRKIPSSRFNDLTTLAVATLLILNAYLTKTPIKELLELVRKSSDAGLAISLSTLGFLISGFTIFATISQPALSIKMSEIRHPESNLSTLKHNYFIFLRVFIYYLCFAFFCLLITMLGHQGGLVALAVSYFDCMPLLKPVLVKTSYVILFTGYFYLLIQLKSFIFNIYHAVMTSLRWKAEGYDKEEGNQNTPSP